MTETTTQGEPSVIDFDKLLADIPGGLPGGVDLREDKQSKKFYDVRDARKAELDSDRMRRRFSQMKSEELEYELSQLQSDPRKSPNWAHVVELATRVLSESSKDLWVMAWLVEALVQEHGIAGLRDGIRLSRMMCEKFWEHVQPRPNDEEGGWEWTLAQLDGLNVTVKSILPSVSLLNEKVLLPRERDLSSFAYREAESLSRMDPSIRAAKIANGQTTLEDFRLAVTKSTIDELQVRAETIAAARTELQQYYEVFGKLGADFIPSVSGLESELADYENLFQILVKPRFSEVAGAKGADAIQLAVSDGHLTSEASDLSRTKGVLTREDALEGLLRVADFFRRTEPHSPVSYALEQAVRWGRMPLPELLKDLVSEDIVRDSVFRRLGIQEKEDNDRDAYSQDHDS